MGKKIILLFIIIALFSGCSPGLTNLSTPVEPVSKELPTKTDFPTIGMIDRTYDIGQLDIINKLKTVYETGLDDTDNNILGAVLEHQIMTEGEKTYILANIYRYKAGDNGIDIRENCWILNELGTNQYTWLSSNAELLEFASPNYISFKTSDALIRAELYTNFPEKVTYINSGKEWHIKEEAYYVGIADSVDFGWRPGKDGKQEGTNENPTYLSDVYLTLDGIAFVTKDTYAMSIAPYVFIESMDGGKAYRIILKGCGNKVTGKAKTNDYSVVDDYTIEQSGNDTVLTIKMHKELFNDLIKQQKISGYICIDTDNEYNDYYHETIIRFK